MCYIPDEVESGPLLTLDNDEAEVIFLKLLVRYLDDVPTSGSHDNFLTTLLPKLRKHRILVTHQDVKKKRESLRNQYTRNKNKMHTDHPLFLLESVVFGKQPASVLNGTPHAVNFDDEPEDEDDKFLSDLIKYSTSECHYLLPVLVLPLCECTCVSQVK